MPPVWQPPPAEPDTVEVPDDPTTAPPLEGDDES